jgi:DNA-binding NtrC family response regulator
MIQPEDLPSTLIQETQENIIEKSLREKYTIEQLENKYIRRVLMEVGGNKSKAAEMLGLDRRTLYRKLQEE